MKLLTGLFLISILGFLLIKQANDSQVATQTTATPSFAPTINSSILSSRVNSWRTEKGLNHLPEEESLCQYAEKRTIDIQTEWNHDIFKKDSCLNTNYVFCGENLAKGYQTEEQVLQAWIASPTHYDNLIREWSAMCIKCKDGYCAQQFGI